MILHSISSGDVKLRNLTFVSPLPNVLRGISVSDVILYKRDRSHE